MNRPDPICGFDGCTAPGTHSLAKVNDSPYWFLTRSRHVNANCEAHARALLISWNDTITERLSK